MSSDGIRYLVQEPVDIATHPVYSKYTPTDWAMYFLEHYGQIDGGHHKAWVLDQMARAIKGTPVIVECALWSDGQAEDRVWLGDPSTEYIMWRDTILGGHNGDEREYDYDEGIAP